MNKTEVLNALINFLGGPELVLVDDIFPDYTRHICSKGRTIYLLQKRVFWCNTNVGVIPVEYYYCNMCHKVIVNRNFM